MQSNMSLNPLHAGALVLTMCIFGCDVEIIYIDPPIHLIAAPSAEPTGPPHLELGVYEGTRYTRLEDGASLPVVNGLQGGTWTMPAVRTQGLGAYAELTCALETDAGERVGYVSAKTKFFFNGAGSLEVGNFPIPVYHPDRPHDTIEDLFGVEATLSCSLVNDVDEAHFQARVIISDG